jgi:hypothetical protein
VGLSVAGGASLASGSATATWLTVPVGSAAQNVTGQFAAAGGNVTVFARTVGNGTVVLNGTPLTLHPSNATAYGSVVGAPGTYTATALPSPGWTFLGWTDAPGAVAIPMGNTTNATVAAGTAYLYGEFAANLTVLTTPVGLGEVSFNDSTPVGNDTVVPLTRGTYTLAAAPASDAAFQHWTVSDPRALYVTRPGFAFSKLVVNGTGTVTAVFAPATNHTLTLRLAPASGGYVQFNFVNLTASVTVNTTVVNTTYELRGFPALGYRFLGFNTTGPVSFSGGELSVTGTGGVVTAKFGVKFYPVTVIATRPGSAALSLAGAPVASGTTLSLPLGVYNLSASALGSNTSFLGWSSSLTVANITSHGTATVKVEGAGTVIAIIALFVLNGLGVSPATVDINAPVHFSIFVNGSGALQYRYFGLPAGCSSVDQPTLTCDPSAAGTYAVHATVTDSGGAAGTTAPVLLDVDGNPYVSAFTVTPAATDVGVPANFLVTPQLGLGPYSFVYADLPAGCQTANVANLSCTPSAAGTGRFQVQVTVTDSTGHVAEANVSLTVNAVPRVVSTNATLPTTDIGIATRINVTTTGGTGPLSYSYAGLPTGCASASTPTLRCDPIGPGTSSVTVTVSDALGLSAVGTVSLLVNPRPSDANLAFAPTALILGQTTDVRVTFLGGTGPVQYTYLGLPPGCVAVDEATFACTPTATNTYSLTVIVTDALGANTSDTGSLGVTAPVSAPPTSSTSGVNGIDWLVVALFAVVALVVSAVLVWRFGRPPPPTPAPAAGATFDAPRP